MKEKILKYSRQSRDDRLQGEVTEIDEGIVQGKTKFNTDKSSVFAGKKSKFMGGGGKKETEQKTLMENWVGRFAEHYCSQKSRSEKNINFVTI